MTFVKYLDLVVLALALPVFLLAGWPMLGYAAGAVAWLAQRAIQSYTNAKAIGVERAACGRRLGRGIDDRTRMARSPYDLRRWDGGERRGPRRRGPRDRLLHRLLHREHDPPPLRAAPRGAALLMRARLLVLLTPVPVRARRAEQRAGARHQRGLQAAERVQARSLDPDRHRPDRHVDQQGRRLRPRRLLLTIFLMLLHRQAHAAEARAGCRPSSRATTG